MGTDRGLSIARSRPSKVKRTCSMRRLARTRVYTTPHERGGNKCFQWLHAILRQLFFPNQMLKYNIFRPRLATPTGGFTDRGWYPSKEPFGGAWRLPLMFSNGLVQAILRQMFVM